MKAVLGEAISDGSLSDQYDPEDLLLLSRALCYGLARMNVAGHFPTWYTKLPPKDAADLSLKLLVKLLSQTDSLPPNPDTSE